MHRPGLPEHFAVIVEHIQRSCYSEYGWQSSQEQTSFGTGLSDRCFTSRTSCQVMHSSWSYLELLEALRVDSILLAEMVGSTAYRYSFLHLRFVSVQQLIPHLEFTVCPVSCRVLYLVAIWPSAWHCAVEYRIHWGIAVPHKHQRSHQTVRRHISLRQTFRRQQRCQTDQKPEAKVELKSEQMKIVWKLTLRRSSYVKKNRVYFWSQSSCDVRAATSTSTIKTGFLRGKFYIRNYW